MPLLQLPLCIIKRLKPIPLIHVLAEMPVYTCEDLVLSIDRKQVGATNLQRPCCGGKSRS